MRDGLDAGHRRDAGDLVDVRRLRERERDELARVAAVIEHRFERPGMAGRGEEIRQRLMARHDARGIGADAAVRRLGVPGLVVGGGRRSTSASR